jgi:hypothetical protein
MVKHPVIAIERAEKADLQLGLGRRIDDLRRALGIVERAVGLAAPVPHRDLAIAAQRVFGGDAVAVFLETLLIARQFVPLARIALQFDLFRRLRHGGVPYRMLGKKRSTAAQKQDGSGQGGDPQGAFSSWCDQLSGSNVVRSLSAAQGSS